MEQMAGFKGVVLNRSAAGDQRTLSNSVPGRQTFGRFTRPSAIFEPGMAPCESVVSAAKFNRIS